MTLVGLGEIAALLGVLVAIELAQLGVLGSTWIRSKQNERRIRVLLRSIGIDPDDPPTFEIDETAHRAARADGGDRPDE